MTGWAEKLEQKYIDLFEVFEEDSILKGQVIRGIECGEGWSKHIENFLKNLEWIKDNYDYYDNPKYGIGKETMKIRGEKPNIKIFQIKEKFGECRCYVSGPEHTRNILDRATAKLETLCSLTCENCGKLEEGCIKASPKRWIYCLCNACYENRVLKPDYI